MEIDVNTIVDLPTLQSTITEISEEIKEWTILPEQAQWLIEQLQQKYINLTDTTNTDIEATFDVIQKKFDESSLPSYTLPLWAKKMWMTLPVWMWLDTIASQKNITSESASIIIVYTWNYDVAMQQAEIIAQKAHLYVSKNFQQAQAIANIGNIKYISWLDIGGLVKWIIYTNHALLDTNIENLLSVGVDQNWVLTIESTKYID